MIIRENLWQALWHLRKRGFATAGKLTRRSATLIWIDALCISQQDVRGETIKIAGWVTSISRQKEDFTWLGSTGLADAPLYGGISQDIKPSDMEESSRREIQKIYTYQVRGRFRDYQIESIKDEEVQTNFWSALVSLLHRLYWQRMWIVREITTPRKVTLICGEYEAGFGGLYKLSSLLSRDHLIEGTKVRFQIQSNHALRYIHHRHDSDEKNTLFELMRTCQYSLSVDPRDKVYALLGLALDCQKDEIVVDYSKPLFELYGKVV
jgi:hypothetical protein